MSRLPKADFGGNRFQGRAQSRNEAPVQVASNQKKLQGELEQLKKDQSIQNREDERAYQMESLELDAQQGLDSTAQRIAQEVEGQFLQAQHLSQKANLSASQLQERSELALDSQWSQNRDTVNSQHLRNNQTLDKSVLGRKHSTERIALQTHNTIQNANTRLIGNTIQSILSFGGSVVQYAQNKDGEKQVQKAKQDSIDWIQGSDLGIDQAVIQGDVEISQQEIAGEQAIRSVTNSPIEQSSLRGPNANQRAERARRQTSTRDFGTALYGNLKDWYDQGGSIQGPNGPISINSPSTFEEANYVLRYGIAQQFQKANVSGMDSAEAVRTLRSQVDATYNQFRQSEFAGLEKRQTEDRAFAFKTDFYSKATSGGFTPQQMFDELKDSHVVNGMSASAASKEAFTTMRDFYQNTNRSDDLESLYGVQQIPGQAGTELRNMYGDDIETAVADTYSDRDTADKNLYNDTYKGMLEQLQDVDNPADRLGIISSTISQLEGQGLGKQARQLAGQLGKLKNPNAALIGDEMITSQIANGEVSTSEQVKELRSLGLLTEAGEKKALELVKKSGFSKMPTDDISKNTIKSAQGKAANTFLRAMGVKKDLSGQYTLDKGFKEKPIMSAEDAKDISEQIENEVLILSNRALAANPQLMEVGQEQARTELLRDVHTTYYKENFETKGGKYYVTDFLEQNRQGTNKDGADDYSVEQRTRFDNLLSDSKKFSKIRTSLAARAGKAGIAPINWSGSTDVNTGQITPYALRNYNPLRGDTLLNNEQTKKAHAAWKQGEVTDDLATMASLAGKSPLAILNEASASPLTDRLKLYNPEVLSRTKLGSTSTPVSALEGAKMLIQVGFPEKGASWLAGNIQQESNWYGQRVPWDDVGAPAGGIVSWRAGRLNAIEAHHGKGIENISNADQVRYMVSELKKYHIPKLNRTAYQVFMNPRSTDRQLVTASVHYWGYGDEGARYSYARQIENQL